MLSKNTDSIQCSTHEIKSTNVNGQLYSDRKDAFLGLPLFTNGLDVFLQF